MKKLILLIGLFFIVFVGLQCIVVAQQNFTEGELKSNVIGNKQTILTVTITYSQTAGMRYYQLFRCTETITVDRIQFRVGTITGSYASPFELLAGIMLVNSSGFYTGWAGAGGDAKNYWVPTASSWNEIVLNQTATLTQGNIYAVGWHDTHNVQSSTRRFYYYTVATPTAGYETVRGKNSSYETNDCFVTRTSASVYVRGLSLLGWFVRDSTKSGYESDAYQGVAYGAVTARAVYTNYAYNQSFYVYSQKTVDCISVKAINNGAGAYHRDTLHLYLYNPSNTLIYSGAVGDNLCHLSSGYSWYDFYMPYPINLTVGRYWFKVWSQCASSTTGYSLMSLALLDTAGNINENLTYQGESYYIKTTTNNGTSYTDVKISDLVFKIRVLPPVVYYTNLVNTEGSVQYKVNCSSYSVWANFTTNPMLRENLNSYLSGTHQYRWNSSTGNLMAWANYSGANLVTSENIVNASGDHESRYNSSTNMWIAWANYTGNLTALHLDENITNATGSHTSKQNATGYWVWANYSGNVSSSGNTSLTIYTNLVNVTGDNESKYNSSTGWIVWVNYTGNLTPFHKFENILFASGTHVSKQNDTGYWIWANYTGDPSTLLHFENIVNATGTHQHSFTAGTNTYRIWANYSGNTTPIHTSDVKKNVTGTLTTFLNITGYWVNSSHESIVNQIQNINATAWALLNLTHYNLTHEKQWDGAWWNDWVNVTSSAFGSFGMLFIPGDNNPIVPWLFMVGMILSAFVFIRRRKKKGNG